jgi:cyclopropane fatty-acyl-phospholipid synthase-like methyltransferase
MEKESRVDVTNMTKDNHDKVLISYWESVFKDAPPMTLAKDDIALDNPLDILLKDLGDTCGTILDFGCGMGYCLMVAALTGNTLTSGVGIDPSASAVGHAGASARQSGIKTLTFKKGDHHTLHEMEASSFDAVIASNVLDVIPKETSDDVIKAIDRVLKPGGKLLVKLNFFLDDALTERIGMEKVSENAYAINGVFRAYNLSLEDWIARFPGYEVLKETTYPRVKDGPLDRVILLEKI